MGYEDSVYLAKLAEQAERYEGKPLHGPASACARLTQHRNGREHEDRRLRRSRALGRGEEFAVGRLQERYRCPSRFLAHRY